MAYALAAQSLLNLDYLPTAALYFTQTGSYSEVEWHRGDGEHFEEMLSHLAELAQLSWPEVVEKTTTIARPCADCGFHGRGCPGTVEEFLD